MSRSGNCLICDAPLVDVLYHLESPTLNSLGRIHHNTTAAISFCDRCSHLQTTPLTNGKVFYEQEYAYHTESLDEDRVIFAPDGSRRYEAEVRSDLMLQSLALQPGARILDYACGKGSTLRWAIEARPDLRLSLYDVTARYVDFWTRFCRSVDWSVGMLPPNWQGSFDAVSCFYALEHFACPVDSMREIASLLIHGGKFYLMVPNVYENPADLLVVDHTHHYSVESLGYLLKRAGFVDVKVSSTAFPSALVAIARVGHDRCEVVLTPDDVAKRRAQAKEIAKLWGSQGEILRHQEAQIPSDVPIAIYGAGFYGAYVYTRLARPDRVACFVDRNPFLHGRGYFGRPVVPPEALDPAIHNVVVGLNPATARRAMSDVIEWRERAITYICLNGS